MATLITYAMTIGSARLSILLLYRRIFDTPGFRVAILCAAAVCGCWLIAAIFAGIFQCHPIGAAFNPDDLFTEKCFNMQAYYHGVIASNLIVDVIVLSLPVSMVWQLKLRVSQKLGLSALFLLGGLVCVASLMRIISVGDLKNEDLSCPSTSPLLPFSSSN